MSFFILPLPGVMLGGGNPGNGFIYFPDFWDIVQGTSIRNIYLSIYIHIFLGFPDGSAIKNPPAVQEIQEIQVLSLGQQSLEEAMATCSSILAWRIP